MCVELRSTSKDVKFLLGLGPTTLESRKNVPVDLSTFRFFSRGYVLISNGMLICSFMTWLKICNFAIEKNPSVPYMI